MPGEPQWNGGLLNWVNSIFVSWPGYV